MGRLPEVPGASILCPLEPGVGTPDTAGVECFLLWCLTDEVFVVVGGGKWTVLRVFIITFSFGALLGDKVPPVGVVFGIYGTGTVEAEVADGFSSVGLVSLIFSARVLLFAVEGPTTGAVLTRVVAGGALVLEKSSGL